MAAAIALVGLWGPPWQPLAVVSDQATVARAANGPTILHLPSIGREASSPPAAVGLELVAQGLTSPVALVQPPDGSGRLFIADQAGLIRIVAGGSLLAEPFLDLRAKMVEVRANYDERGLLGLAFHPDYATNGLFYVYYSAPLREGGPAGFNHASHVSEFKVLAGNANLADPASERVLLRVDQPQSNHNGGGLAFGPADGYLYISLGDGGNRDDEGLGHVADWYAFNEGGNGQDITDNLLGSMLRIDVNQGQPYAIPADNPFVGETEGLDEIYAYGFRNPYRFSFDMGGNHALLVGDVGQELWEEVDVVISGGNYGWNVREGTHCFDAAQPTVPPADCPATTPSGAPLLDPVIELLNGKNPGGVGLAVVGGYVYRGTALPALQAKYVFGMWNKVGFAPPGRGRLLLAEPRAAGLWRVHELRVASNPEGHLGAFLLGMGQDLSGEVYALTTDNLGPAGETGKVFKIVTP
ncbi:MAG: PQQ-dependent sugar dehydrogenase [Chloroflexi bacterium]|nr:PQQ-dependent sugar dehydrogenase [Chloroflexota bacterium]